MTNHRDRQWYLFPGIILIFLTASIVARNLGIVFVDDVLNRFWQYPDVEILRQDLLRGIFYLHSQPPLFNFFLGVTLKLFPETFPLAFQIIYQAMALGTLLSMAYLMRALQVTSSLILLLTAGFALFPAFPVYTNYLFYALPAAFLLLLSAICLTRFLKSHRILWLHLFFWTSAALVLIRSTYHAAWFLLVVVVAVALTKCASRKTVVLCALLPFLLINMFYAKNYYLIRVYGPSSWLGMNFARGWMLPPSELKPGGFNLSEKEIGDMARAGDLPEEWLRGPFREPEAYRDLGYFQPNRLLHPAWGSPTKSNGLPNFNHRDYALISRKMMAGNLAIIRKYPERYFRRVWVSLLVYFQPGPAPGWYFTRYYDFRRVLDMRDLLAKYVLLSWPIDLVEARIQLNLILLVFPFLVFFGFRRSAYENEPMRLLFAYMAITIVWVTIVVNVFESGENDRMRWEIDPFLLILVGCVVSSVLNRWGVRRSNQ